MLAVSSRISIAFPGSWNSGDESGHAATAAVSSCGSSAMKVVRTPSGATCFRNNRSALPMALNSRGATEGARAPAEHAK